MKDQRVKGSTSVILEIFIQNNSVTTGAGLTALVHNSAGLTCYYHRNTAAAATAVTLVDMTVGTFTSSGFKLVDDTNMPGVYQLCLPDAAFASGADSVSVLLKGATNMAPVVLEIRLTGVDWTDGVRAGLTALPNAAAAANGGLFTRGTGAGQMNQDANGRVDVNIVALGGVVQSLTDLKDFADDGYDPTTNKVQGVVLTDTLTTYTGNTPQTGDSFARLGVAGVGLSNIPWNASWDAEVQSEATDALNAYDPPTNAEMEARTIAAASYATANALDNVDNFIDTEITAIKNVTDLLPDAGALTTIQADIDNLQTRIPAALTGAGNMKADALALNGSTSAAAQLAKSAETIVSGAAIAGTLSTTQMTTDLTEATDEHYNGRIIIWTSGVLIRQATDITAYNGTTKMLTYTATTEAPSNGDTFIIV